MAHNSERMQQINIISMNYGFPIILMKSSLQDEGNIQWSVLVSTASVNNKHTETLCWMLVFVPTHVQDHHRDRTFQKTIKNIRNRNIESSDEFVSMWKCFPWKHRPINNETINNIVHRCTFKEQIFLKIHSKIELLIFSKNICFKIHSFSYLPDSNSLLTIRSFKIIHPSHCFTALSITSYLLKIDLCLGESTQECVLPENCVEGGRLDL